MSGVYTTLTSVDPIRIYVHQQDVLLRFCPTKYHPFDAADKDKYVVGDDYLPSWQVPSFDTRSALLDWWRAGGGSTMQTLSLPSLAC